MKNQIHIKHKYFTLPDLICIRLNGSEVYSGPGNLEKLDFSPTNGTNILTVTLVEKKPGNFYYDPVTNTVLKDSAIWINEIIVENRYFRSLVVKCGLVEIDLEKNLNFPSKYIDHENCITMEGSVYLIKFESPIKHWMQVHLHGRDLNKIQISNQRVQEKLLSQ